MNKIICLKSGSIHQLFNLGKIESGIHSAFYPGYYPFQHGEIACIAGALAFYICQAHAFFDANKRTAAMVSSVFLNLNGFELVYPQSASSSEFATILELFADNHKVSKEDRMNWFDLHKRRI